MTALERIADIIQDVTQNPSVEILADTTAAQVEGWDSLSHIYIIAEIEDAFGIRMTAQEGGSAKTVGDLVAIVDSKLA